MDDMKVLKNAYQLLFNKEVKIDERLTQLSELGHETADHLVSFIQASKRGFHRDKA